MKRLYVGVFLLSSLLASAATYPKFAARQDYTSLAALFTAVGDVNGDGSPDLIANAFGHIYVLFGNGKGSFQAGPSQGTNSGFSLNVSALDLNGDGKLDLLILAGSAEIGITVCFGHGDGTFESGTFYPAGSDGTNAGGGPVVGDFNGDGRVDVVIAGSSGLWLFAGKGDGTFQAGVLAAPLEYGATGIAVADFNQDGQLDVVVGMAVAPPHGDGFQVLFGNGNGTFQAPLRFENPLNVSAVVAGPLNPRLPPAIIVTSGFSSYAYIYQSDGKGGFTGPTYASLPGGGGRGIALGDVNDDGFADIVSPTGSIAFGGPGGNFPTTVTYPVQAFGGNPGNTVLADLRHTGRLDIVADGYYGISVLLNQGGGKFLDGKWSAAPSGYCGTSGDFNLDGKQYVAIANAAGISLLLGTGSPQQPFQAGAVLPLANAGCPVAGDVNGDGIVDLVVHSPSGVAVFLGTGIGTFTQKSLIPTAADGILVLADFNHDGKLDFATSANLLVLGNGDGAFQTPKALMSNPPANGFSTLAAGDLNNDGWPDVILTYSGLPLTNAYVMLNDQHGGFTQVPASFGQGKSGLILADLNRDGNLDLVVSPSTLIYLGDGHEGFSASAGVPAGLWGLTASCSRWWRT
ncbi:MAG: VCBS repeat-containing protein [Bryobacteraceae bacterium]